MTASITEVSGQAFDYIIVGGGTAGLTVAARLSEDASVSVLVLEAGLANIDEPGFLRPASFGSQFTSKTLAWQHKWVKQKFANDREHVWERGKGLGGSSGINFLCWLKPFAADIDDLERLGNPGWNWKNYQKYVERTEGFIEPSTELKTRINQNFDDWKIGRNGPVILAYYPKLDEGELQMRDTFFNAGFKPALLPMSGDPEGYFFVPNTYDPRTHTRSYATTAFYLPNKDRKNLTVLVTAPTRRVIFRKTASGELIAFGVEFEYDGKTHQATANKEVLVSAGAVQSPHVLEQSGIGRADLLKTINIPVTLDLPGVGENVQEHICIGVTFELKEDVEWETLDLLRDPAIAAKHLELHKQGKGIFTSGLVGYGYAPLNLITPKAAELYKKMQEFVANLDPETTPPGLLEQYKILLERFGPDSRSHGAEMISIPGLLSRNKPPQPGKRYATITSTINHTWARGTIHSVSNDPKEVPEINPHYFEHGFDLDILVECVKWVREKFANTSPFKDMIVGEYVPGPEVQTDAQLRDWIKACFSTIWHTAGTCSMLPRDKNGVVDHNLKVYGTENLRVIDLSVLPLHIAAHTQATTYAIAEQGADILKGKFSP